MRSKRVTRFYCDHCNKGGFSAKLMAEHESRCVLNPARTCGYCADYRMTQKPIAELIAILDGSKDELANLEHATAGCPACMLSAMMQLNAKLPHDERNWYEWNYKTALSEFKEERRPHEIANITIGIPDDSPF